MILNEEQTTAIQEKITFVVDFRETYEEVYDHVISVIEDTDTETKEVEQLTDQIIELDFGGYGNLIRMEIARAKLVRKVMRKNHWQNVMSFFNWPTIAFTLAITVAGYYLTLDPVNRKHLMGLTAIWGIMPISFLFGKMLFKKYKQWQWNIYQKQSIKDGYVFAAAMLSSSLTNVLNFALHNFVLYGPVTLCVFVFYTIYVLSFFKLYRNEYKMNIAR